MENFSLTHSRTDRRTSALAAVLAAAALSGCAGFNRLSSDVSAYSVWPAGKTASTYVFDRLPSQQTEPKMQDALEAAAQPALAAAGFMPAADPATADFTVQLGAHVRPDDRWIYDDPFWWRGGLYRGWYGAYGGHGYWGGYGGFGHYGRFGGGWGYDAETYEHEAALLIRDRKTGVPLYEARASNSGFSPSIDNLLQGLYRATLSDFPNATNGTHRVDTPIK